MKYLLYTTMVLFFLGNTSCSGDDEQMLAEGDIALKFDNIVAGSDLIIDNAAYINSSNNNYKVQQFKYIISNVVLIDTDGNEFALPKAKSMFIIDEADANAASEIWKMLNTIDAKDYRSIKFGIGVDQEQYLLGAEGQGDFLDLASQKGMMWGWQAGYKFLRIDGLYTSENIPTETQFAIHMGSHGSSLDNYKEISLDFPSTLRVRNGNIPEIHILCDLSKLFDGEYVFDLEEKDQIHVDAERAPKLASNFSKAFSVHHIHN